MKMSLSYSDADTRLCDADEVKRHYDRTLSELRLAIPLRLRPSAAAQRVSVSRSISYYAS